MSPTDRPYPTPDQVAEWKSLAIEHAPRGLKLMGTQRGQWEWVTNEVAILAHVAGVKAGSADVERKAREAADAELEACCEWLEGKHYSPFSCKANVIDRLREARRPTPEPEPPSLRQQALEIWRRKGSMISAEEAEVISLALEVVPETITFSDIAAPETITFSGVSGDHAPLNGTYRRVKP
jgi:hypothetical protein